MSTKTASQQRDRLGTVITISIILHLIIVLGISFVIPSQAKDQSFSPPLKITMVLNHVENDSEDAEILAQANSKGDDKLYQAAQTELPTLQSLVKNEQINKEQALLSARANAHYNPVQSQKQQKTQPESPTDRQQLTNAINLAYLNANAQPREKFVSSNTRASEIAPYLEKWRLLVERVGNLNYPDAAKRQKLEGELVMDVTLNADGSIKRVDILESSGHKILDDAAERIVHIAAPFDKFSDEMQRYYDTLHIIRTWKFSQNTLQDVTR